MGVSEELKPCPVCGARCFSDARICFGCLHRFAEKEAAVDECGRSGGEEVHGNMLSASSVEAEEGPASHRRADVDSARGESETWKEAAPDIAAFSSEETVKRTEMPVRVAICGKPEVQVMGEPPGTEDGPIEVVVTVRFAGGPQRCGRCGNGE